MVFKGIMDLDAQRDQLLSLAKAEEIDVTPVDELPDDPRLQIAGFATLLRIDPMAALRGSVPVKRLVTEARKKERARAKYEREELKRLRDLGIDIELEQEG
jgi:hypothetical protein